MASDMVQKVLEAEKEARRLLDEANARAEDIIAKARADAENLSVQSADEAKEKARLLLAAAEKEAHALVLQSAEKSESEADHLRKHAKARMDDALDGVLSFFASN